MVRDVGWDMPTHDLLGKVNPHINVGVVVIGRNEGDRLKRCFVSVLAHARRVVYVDSGSTDGSAQWAQAQGAGVVDLDLTRPFTAARARNEGFERLLELEPSIPFVQFVDGDCEVASGWLANASEFLETHPQAAAACGRRRERNPHHSIYNMLCDIEWDSPVGQARSCGGDVMMRASALKDSGGYRESLIAGEEPELCVRLRQAGWQVWRLPSEMTLHDAAMVSFGQWWKRTKRCGHAYAEGAWLHGAKPERHCVRQTMRAVTWGGLLPFFTIGSAMTNPMWLLLLLAYPLQIFRLALRYNIASSVGRFRAFFTVLARFPECEGAMQYWFNRLRQRHSVLIEYK
jgi:GT2 family glycosyltransferase